MAYRPARHRTTAPAAAGNFHSAALGADFSASGNSGVVIGSSSVTAAPFVGPLPGNQDTTKYLSIGGNGSETITFASEKNAFGLYWGSLDSYNTHQILRRDDARRLLYRRPDFPAVPDRRPGFILVERVCRIFRPALLQQGRAQQHLERIRDRQHFRRIHCGAHASARSWVRSASMMLTSATR